MVGGKPRTLAVKSALYLRHIWRFHPILNFNLRIKKSMVHRQSLSSVWKLNVLRDDFSDHFSSRAKLPATTSSTGRHTSHKQSPIVGSTSLTRPTTTRLQQHSAGICSAATYACAGVMATTTTELACVSPAHLLETTGSCVRPSISAGQRHAQSRLVWWLRRWQLGWRWLQHNHWDTGKS